MIYPGSIKHTILVAIAVAFFASAAACSDTSSPPVPPTPPDTSITTFGYTVIDTFAHDPNAFVQGLVCLDSVFIEGTGYHYGPSTLRRVRIETGTIAQIRDMPPPAGGSAFFGEGVAVWGDTIVQLTWQGNTAVVYDRDSFDEIGRFQYPTEGWGLTHDGSRYIMSDGSSTLYFRDRDTFAELDRVQVTDEFGAVNALNELEYIDGLVWANRYQTGWIVMIDPATGRVRGRFHLGNLGDLHRGVANGIAWDPIKERLFVTGKLWLSVYEIQLTEQ